MEGQDLTTILEDFKDITTRAHEEKKHEENRTNSRDRIHKDIYIYNLQFLPDSTVWYKPADRHPDLPELGTPSDYIPIRDNYQALKEFLGKTLDAGEKLVGSRDPVTISPAHYFMWMHRHSEHQPFKDNLERAVVELLEEEFKKEFKAPEYGKMLEQEKQWDKIHTNNSSFFFRDDLNLALSHRTMLAHATTKADKALKNEFIREVKKTSRPITLREVYSTYAGERSDLKKAFESGDFKKVEKLHFTELPTSLKKRIRDYRVRYFAEMKALEQALPQYNRMLGLLEIIFNSGTKSNGFANAKPLLQHKVKEQYMKQPTFATYDRDTNIYVEIIQALSSVQEDTTLKNFWLENIRSENSAKIAIVSLHAYFRMYSTATARKNNIPAALQSLQSRSNRRENINGYAERIIGTYLSEKFRLLGKLTHLDHKAGTYDVLEKTVDDGQWKTLTFTRYSTKGTTALNGRMNKTTYGFQGPPALDSTLRDYVQFQKKMDASRK
jgi:hypothetical protein